MTETVQVLVDGQPVHIEVEAAYGDERTSGGAVERALNSFEQAKQTIVNLSTDMVRAVRSIDQALTPNEFTLEFGIKFKVDGSVVIAAVSTEATLTVKLVYNHKPVPASEGRDSR